MTETEEEWVPSAAVVDCTTAVAMYLIELGIAREMAVSMSADIFKIMATVAQEFDPEDFIHD